MVASVDDIRRRFPALERTHAGHPVAYFDGPGGTQVPRAVADAVSDYLLHHNANTHWAFPTSAETDAALAEARTALADLLGADAHEVVLGANMTTLAYRLSRALGRRLDAGDELIVTDLDHQANVAPWRALEVERGVTVHTVPFEPDTGRLDETRFDELLGPRTRFVAFGAASNALGTINDIAGLTARARAAGALVFVDAVHYAPHEQVDVRAWDCDFLACSAYKFYGPHVGVLYGRERVLAELDVPKLPPAPDTVPERLETGTLNHEGIVGSGAAVDFLAGLGPDDPALGRRERLRQVFEALEQRGAALVERLWNGLEDVEAVRCYGPRPGTPRTPTVAFTVAGVPPRTVAERLAGDWGVFVSNGDFYASTVAETYGLADEGLVRAGCACYTTEEEVDRLVEGVAEIARTA